MSNMYYKLILVAVVFFIIGGLYVLYIKKNSKEATKDFDPQTSARLVKNGALLIDVRSQAEYDSGHVRGAHHIPHLEIKTNQDLLKELSGNNPQKAIVVYCQSGKRSQHAKEELKHLGYQNVVNHGGIDSWQK